MDAIVLLKNHVDERFGALPLQEQLFEISMVTTQEEMVDLEQNLADQEYLDKFVRNYCFYIKGALCRKNFSEMFFMHSGITKQTVFFRIYF